MTTVRGDTPIHLRTVLEMSDDDLDALLTDKRERRLIIQRHREEAVQARVQVSSVTIGKRIDKYLAMLTKELGVLDRAMEKCEKRVLDIRALRLQYGDGA